MLLWNTIQLYNLVLEYFCVDIFALRKRSKNSAYTYVMVIKEEKKTFLAGVVVVDNFFMGGGRARGGSKGKNMLG